MITAPSWAHYVGDGLSAGLSDHVTSTGVGVAVTSTHSYKCITDSILASFNVQVTILTSVIIIHSAVASTLVLPCIGLQQLNGISTLIIRNPPLAIRFHSGGETSELHAVHCEGDIL